MPEIDILLIVILGIALFKKVYKNKKTRVFNDYDKKCSLAYRREDWKDIIDESQKILMVVSISDKKKIDIYLKLAYSYYCLSNYEEASRYYLLLYNLAKKINRTNNLNVEQVICALDSLKNIGKMNEATYLHNEILNYRNTKKSKKKLLDYYLGKQISEL